MLPTLQFVVPGSELHGGIRVPLEICDWMAQRGWSTRVIGPGSPPDWHDLQSPWHSIDLAAGEQLPAATVTVATFFSTVSPSVKSDSRVVFHLCQGYEGQFLEYSDIRPNIEAAYRAPIPKLLVSDHLEALLEGIFPDCRCHVIGEAVDTRLFRPSHFREDAQRLRIGVVGSFSSRIKRLQVAFEGLRMARDLGLDFEVHRASAEVETDDEKTYDLTTVYSYRLPTKQMPRFYARIDALLFTSLEEEGFGLPVIEAMSCGVPVLHSDIPSLRAIPADATLRFRPDAVEEISSLLLRLQDSRERARLREKGLEAVKMFHPDNLLARFEKALLSEGVALPLNRPE